jgi:hypothetical protein
MAGAMAILERAAPALEDARRRHGLRTLGTVSKASHLPAWGLPPRLRLSGVRHLYIVSDRRGVWATLRPRPMPQSVQG